MDYVVVLHKKVVLLSVASKIAKMMAINAVSVRASCNRWHTAIRAKLSLC